MALDSPAARAKMLADSRRMRVRTVFLIALWISAGQTAPLTPEETTAALKQKKGILYEVKTTFSWKRNDFGGELVAFARYALLQTHLAGANGA